MSGRLAIGAELGASLHPTQFKLLSAGERVLARRAHGALVQVTVRCMAVCTSNADPRFVTPQEKEPLGADNGVDRRILAFDFNATFRHEPQAKQKKAIDDMFEILSQDAMQLAHIHISMDAHKRVCSSFLLAPQGSQHELGCSLQICMTCVKARMLFCTGCTARLQAGAAGHRQEINAACRELS